MLLLRLLPLPQRRYIAVPLQTFLALLKAPLLAELVSHLVFLCPVDPRQMLRTASRRPRHAIPSDPHHQRRGTRRMDNIEGLGEGEKIAASSVVHGTTLSGYIGDPWGLTFVPEWSLYNIFKQNGVKQPYGSMRE